MCCSCCLYSGNSADVGGACTGVVVVVAVVGVVVALEVLLLLIEW